MNIEITLVSLNISYAIVCVGHFHDVNGFYLNTWMYWASLVAQTIKNLPAMQETQVQFLGWKIPWKRKWETTLVFLPGEFHGQRSLVEYSPWGHRVGHNWVTNTFTFFHFSSLDLIHNFIGTSTQIIKFFIGLLLHILN